MPKPMFELESEPKAQTTWSRGLGLGIFQIGRLGINPSFGGHRGAGVTIPQTLEKNNNFVNTFSVSFNYFAIDLLKLAPS